MLSLDPFTWWILTISWSIAFLIAVSVYLYSNSKPKRTEGHVTAATKTSLGQDFVFVWVLVGLLVFYIVSVYLGSSLIFAAGNIVVEVVLILYLLKTSHKKPE